MTFDRLSRSALARYGMSVIGVLAATLVLSSLTVHVNSTTVALVFLLLVLSTATFFGRNPALLASFMAMLSFNYIFLPPVFTWHIADPQNLVAWAAFTVTAIVAGELSAYARRRARESERLFEELQTAFRTATQAEAFRQSEKLKSALLDAVTHDLRTPLTSIKASVTTLLDSEGGHRTIELDSEGRAEFLAIINEETDRLNRFIEGMVELARIEAGPVGSTGSRANADEIIANALERSYGIASGHRINVIASDDLPALCGDARAIAEVVYNLVENAVKYSPPETVITIKAEQRGSNAVISVIDEGIGIPEAMRKKVFEKFVRVEGQRADGLGLGLAIARGIVEAQNGTIELRTGENEIGTMAVISFPVAE